MKPMIELSGVRSSWDILARNADLRWSAASARSLAYANSLVRFRHDPLQLDRVAVGCFIELCILNGQGQLSRYGFQETQLLLGRLPFGAREHTQDADPPACRDQRV